MLNVSRPTAMDHYPTRLRHGSGAWVTLDPTRLLLTLKRPWSIKRLTPRLAECGFVRDQIAMRRRGAEARLPSTRQRGPATSMDPARRRSDNPAGSAPARVGSWGERRAPRTRLSIRQPRARRAAKPRAARPPARAPDVEGVEPLRSRAGSPRFEGSETQVRVPLGLQVLRAAEPVARECAQSSRQDALGPPRPRR